MKRLQVFVSVSAAVLVALAPGAKSARGQGKPGTLPIAKRGSSATLP